MREINGQKEERKKEKEYANIFLYFNKMKHFSRVHIFCMQELTTHRVKVTVSPKYTTIQ